MLTLEEIKNCKINYEIIREALEQSEKRLKDYLQTMKDINQKTFIYFNAYLTIIIGLISAGYIIKDKNIYPQLLDFIFIFSPFILCSLILFILALHSFNYGSVGSDPEMWLEKDIIEGDKDRLSKMLGEITFYHENRIAESLKSNGKKLKFQEAGIYLSILGIIASIIIFPFPLFSLSPLYQFLSLLIGIGIAYLIAWKW